MIELFKDIPEYEGSYQISTCGTVKSLKRAGRKNDIFLIKTLDSNGYYKVDLSKNGKSKTFKVSVLLAMAFMNHKPNGYKVIVDHKDNIRTNDFLNNLQLITARENTSKDRTGTSKYRGVSWYKRDCKWRAQIRINGNVKTIGMFESEIKAHEAYQLEAKLMGLSE